MSKFDIQAAWRSSGKSVAAFCGWFGTRNSEPPARLILEKMSSALVAPGDNHGQFFESNASGVWVSNGDAAQDALRNDRLWVAIQGAPRWADARLAEVAATRGNAAAAAESYRQHGPDFLRQLRGAFSIAVADHAERRLLLAIDRSGIQSLYFAHQSNGPIVFGSRPDLLLGHPNVDPTISAQAILDYLYFWWIPAPTTIYETQRKLLPGQYLVWSDGRVRTDFYWTMPYDQPSHASLEALAKELRDTIETGVKRSLGDHAGARTGAFLSGGLDSSSVAGYLGKVAGSRAKTFTIGFGRDGFDETEYANITARHFGTEHFEHVMTPADFFESAESVARFAPEPFANSSIIPVYCCAKYAKEKGIDLMLAGDGGDELFAGNKRYATELLYERFNALPGFARAILGGIADLLPSRGLPSPLGRARNYVQYARKPLPDRTQSQNPFAGTDLGTVFASALLARVSAEAPLETLREVYHRTKSDSVLHRLLHLDLKIILADGDIRKVNTACELAGVAVRYPFLDDDVVEFSARVPPGMMMEGTQLRSFFKKAMKGFLADDTINKKKQGFGMPTLDYMKSHRPLQELALDSLESFRKRRILRSDFLDGIVAAYRASESDTHMSGLLCDVMFLEQWLQQHVGERTGL